MTERGQPVGSPAADLMLPEHREPVLTNRERMAIPRQPMPELPAAERVRGFGEVALGYELRAGRIEALRCLGCRKPVCVDGCPVGIDIPGFIKKIAAGDLEAGLGILMKDNVLPAICGRVCPQEEQCEVRCTVGKKNEPVAIGRLERLLADWGRAHGRVPPLWRGIPTGKRVVIVGAGPAGLTAAADLIRLGYEVTVLEGLQAPGGVLTYGIPPFRLPREVVRFEVEQLIRAGVELHTSVIVGQTVTLEELRRTFDAVFIATGAGLPYFMNIPGESLCGVYSANEFLTRVNLMHAHEFPRADTPIAQVGQVAVVGGGNVAMDAARTALRLGATKVSIVYRRSRAEMPARLEEIDHAAEEGVQMFFLHSPVRYEGDERGRVRLAVVQRMVLGEPDASGRRRPVPVDEFVELPVDTVVVAIGNGPNPLVPRATPELAVKKWGNIRAESASGKTNLPWVWAGGDIVLGAATVILAMGAGRTVARSIDEVLREGRWTEPTLDS